MEEGVRCLAVPIFDRRRQCVGTLSVSGPTTRLTTERVAKLAPSARLVADELSRQLGFDTKLAGDPRPAPSSSPAIPSACWAIRTAARSRSSISASIAPAIGGPGLT